DIVALGGASLAEAVELFEVERSLTTDTRERRRPERLVDVDLFGSAGRERHRGYQINPVSVRYSSDEMRLVATRWRTRRAYALDILSLVSCGSCSAQTSSPS